MKIEPVPKIEEKNRIEAMQMLINNDLRDVFQKIDREYLYWDKVKYSAPENIDKHTLWHAVKIQRQLNSQIVRFGKYVFHFTITKNMLALLHAFDMDLGGNLGTKSIIPASDKSYYLISSIME
jgi:hypothetical protein